MTTAYENLVKNLNKSQILQVFPDVIPLESRPNTASSSDGLHSGADDKDVFKNADEEQIKLMNENCIVLDFNDESIGSATKKSCHLSKNIEKGLLHRAFSVFLFNYEGKLLLQQRSDDKITFPDLWTNTCCSHPLCVNDELGDKTLESKIKGTITASKRKLDHELGINADQLMQLGEFHFLNRIHYMANSNDNWGEHEIDYILFYKQTKQGNLIINPSENEVKDVRWVDANELQKMFNDTENYSFTPWFKIICKNYLFNWWNELDSLDKIENDKNIYRML